MEDFLLHARIIDTVRTLKGVTGARQVTLSDGRVTHDAQVQDVDIYKAIFEVGPKNTEVNFRDTYRYNDALLARRDVIVKLFDDKIAQRSEAAVLYTLAR